MVSEVEVKHGSTRKLVLLISLVVAIVSFACSFAGAAVAIVALQDDEGGAGRDKLPPPRAGGASGPRKDGKGQVGTTGMWEPGLKSSVSASRVGRALAPVTMYEATRRRMHTITGRMLVAMASVDSDVCGDLATAAQETGDLTGQVAVTHSDQSVQYASGNVNSASTNG